MSPDHALISAESAGRIALRRGEELAQRRDRDQPLAHWHPLVIVALGVVAGGLCGRLMTRSGSAAVAAVPIAAPVLAWLQARPAALLRDWMRTRREVQPPVDPAASSADGSSP